MTNVWAGMLACLGSSVCSCPGTGDGVGITVTGTRVVMMMLGLLRKVVTLVASLAVHGGGVSRMRGCAATTSTVDRRIACGCRCLWAAIGMLHIIDRGQTDTTDTAIVVISCR